MYVSPGDVQEAKQQSIDVCHRLGLGYLDSVESYIKMSSWIAREVMQESSKQIDSFSSDEKPSEWIGQFGAINQRLLSSHVPTLFSSIFHTEVKRTEQVWEVAGNQFNESGKIARQLFDRSLKMSPWETFWLLDSARKTMDESIATVSQISSAAIEASERFDSQIQEKLSDQPGQ